MDNTTRKKVIEELLILEEEVIELTVANKFINQIEKLKNTYNYEKAIINNGKKYKSKILRKIVTFYQLKTLKLKLKLIYSFLKPLEVSSEDYARRLYEKKPLGYKTTGLTGINKLTGIEYENGKRKR